MTKATVKTSKKTATTGKQAKVISPQRSKPRAATTRSPKKEAQQRKQPPIELAPEKQNELRRKNRERMASKRQSLTPAQQKAMREKNRQRMAYVRRTFPNEKREEEKKKNRERMARKRKAQAELLNKIALGIESVSATTELSTIETSIEPQTEK